MIAKKRGGPSGDGSATPFPYVSKPKRDVFFRLLAEALATGETWKKIAAKQRHYFTEGRIPNGDELRRWVQYLVSVHDVPEHFATYWTQRFGRVAERIEAARAGDALQEDVDAHYLAEIAKLASERADIAAKLDESRANVARLSEQNEALRARVEKLDEEAKLRLVKPAEAREAAKLRTETAALREEVERARADADAACSLAESTQAEARAEIERVTAEAAARVAAAEKRAADAASRSSAATMSDAEILRRAGEIAQRVSAAAAFLGGLGGG